jgi:DNA-binding NarL/FixJ family response regulator
MRVLCVGRHHFLSEHLCRFFENLGVGTVPCVGMREALELIPAHDPDAVICDYDLLATIPLSDWETDAALRSVPVVAVSLTRHPGEAHLLDINGIAGFLYLPTLDPDDARRILAGIRRARGRVTPPNGLPWPRTTPVAQVR